MLDIEKLLDLTANLDANKKLTEELKFGIYIGIMCTLVAIDLEDADTITVLQDVAVNSLGLDLSQREILAEFITGLNG